MNNIKNFLQYLRLPIQRLLKVWLREGIIWIFNINIKFIPFYTIINTTVRIKDIIAGIILFIIYVMWVYVNGYSIIEYHNKIFESLVQDKNETPLMFLLEKIKVYFKKYTI